MADQLLPAPPDSDSESSGNHGGRGRDVGDDKRDVGGGEGGSEKKKCVFQGAVYT